MVFVSDISFVSFVVIAIIIFLSYEYETSIDVDDFIKTTKENGYTSKGYVVTTKDRYRLTVFRMDAGKHCKDMRKMPPVLLMHGILESSDVFIDAGPKAGLAYLLADACYDVWVGNTRGNYYSRGHFNLDPNKDEEYWKFSADEIGTYDLPAKIDYILNNTQSSRINFIGFSESGATAFIMCSEVLEYCEKLGIIISLSPATRLINTSSGVVIRLFQAAMSYESVLYKFKVYEIFSKNSIMHRLLENTCSAKLNKLTRYICQTILSIFDSSNPGSITDETIQSVFKHFPAGISVRNAARYGHIYKTGRIQKYDFGEKGNIEKYGTSEPPAYDLKRVTRPVVILHGRNDRLTSIKDSEWAIGELADSELFEVDDPLWNHFDMVYSQYINKTIFNKINMSLLKYSYLS